jgi:hypothetical protein
MVAVAPEIHHSFAKMHKRQGKEGHHGPQSDHHGGPRHGGEDEGRFDHPPPMG